MLLQFDLRLFATSRLVIVCNAPAIRSGALGWLRRMCGGRGVVELGGCAGGNLIPMAEQLPDATFVGLDAGEDVGEVSGLALA